MIVDHESEIDNQENYDDDSGDSEESDEIEEIAVKRLRPSVTSNQGSKATP